MKVSKGQALAGGGVFLFFLLLIFFFSGDEEVSKPENPVTSSKEKKDDKLPSAIRRAKLGSARAGSGTTSFLSVLARGDFFPADESFKVHGAAMVFQNTDGDMILHFEQFSFPTVSGLQIFFARNRQGDDEIFFRDLTAHNGDISISLPDGFNPYARPFVRIRWKSFDRIVAIAEMQ